MNHGIEAMPLKKYTSESVNPVHEKVPGLLLNGKYIAIYGQTLSAECQEKRALYKFQSWTTFTLVHGLRFDSINLHFHAQRNFILYQFPMLRSLYVGVDC